MTRISTTSFRSALALAVTTGIALALLAPGGGARASVPSGPPSFQDPTTIDNVWVPFVPGAVKVFRGRSEGERTHVVDIYLDSTREFAWGAGSVTCRVLQETEFEGGQVIEISTNYFAQADDGTVYYFGETVDEYEDGVVVAHGGSWLVGGPTEGDPEETMTVADPAVFMPASPEVGDEFSPEDLPDGSSELDTVRRIGRSLRTPMTRLRDVLEVGEYHVPDDERETKWYARGIGVVKTKAHREVLLLEAATLSPADPR